MASAKQRILILDDHPMMREGLAQLIRQQPDLEVVGQADAAHEALELIPKVKPDLVLADLTLPGKSGLEFVKDVHAMHPKLSVLVISMHDETLYAERVLRAGARGYVMKQEGGRKMMTAIRQVLHGKVYVSENMSEKILAILTGGPAGPISPVEQLTDREFEVFQMIGRGMNAREIARTLHLSVKTIEVHRTNIKRKLSIKSVTELIHFAVRWVESNPTVAA